MKSQLVNGSNLILPIFNDGNFFCWTNMAWCLLFLIWISGFLLCCRGFKHGGKLSFQIFFAAWIIFFVNNALNSIFSANESLSYFVVLYTISWIVMLAFRWIIEFISQFLKKRFLVHSPIAFRFLSILCGMGMILTVFTGELHSHTFRSSLIIYLTTFLSGLFGWWYQSKKQKESIHHFTYENLYQLEQEILYEEKSSV